MCVPFSHTLSLSSPTQADSDQVWKKLVEALFPVLRLLRVDGVGVDGVDGGVNGTGGGGGEEELVEDILADGRWTGHHLFEGAVPVGDFNLQLGFDLRIERYVAPGIHIVRFLGGRNLLDLDEFLLGVGDVDEGGGGGVGVAPVQKRQHAVAAVSKAAACRPLSTAIGRPWSCC